MEEYPTAIVASDGQVRHGIFRFDDDADDCTLSLTVDDREYLASAHDCFESLCHIRDQLEEIGLRPKCDGAHVAAYPSGLSQGMGYGLHPIDDANSVADLFALLEFAGFTEPLAHAENVDQRFARTVPSALACSAATIRAVSSTPA